MNEKQVLRKRIREAMFAVSPAEAREWSRRIRDRLMETPEWKQAVVILIYLPIPGEVDTEPLIREALKEGKEVAVPRMRGEEMDFHFIDNLQCRWVKHPWGVREPLPEYPVLDLSERLHEKLLVITPGLAFDRKGNRLGRGKGFYDRFLKTAGASVTTVGVCYTLQLVDSVPMDTHDRPMDMVVTEDGVVFPPGTAGI